jgi:hypothetical protein
MHPVVYVLVCMHTHTHKQCRAQEVHSHLDLYIHATYMHIHIYIHIRTHAYIQAILTARGAWQSSCTVTLRLLGRYVIYTHAYTYICTYDHPPAR